MINETGAKPVIVLNGELPHLAVTIEDVYKFPEPMSFYLITLNWGRE
jgi:hypothetical protein